VDAVLDVEFSEKSLARSADANPDWDGRTCAEVYCHGGTMLGGARTTLMWGGEDLECGDCHQLPPPEPHPQNADCALCHSAAFKASGDLKLSVHLNGGVDFKDAPDGGV